MTSRRTAAITGFVGSWSRELPASVPEVVGTSPHWFGPGCDSSLSPVAVLTAVGGATRCDSVFKGFSDCLLQLGDDMRSYPEHLDERENLLHICR